MARGGSRGQRARESAKRIQESRAGMCDALMATVTDEQREAIYAAAMLLGMDRPQE